MAGLRGNNAWLLAAKQTAKGTVADLATADGYKNPFSGGSIAPARETDQLAETDASRDQGVTYVVSAGVEGSPEFYVRAPSIGFWLWAVLGADAVTGVDPGPYTHALTPANALPYITVWRNISDTLFEQFADCKVGSLAISAEAGAPLTATAGIQGIKATRLTAAPDDAAPVAIENSTVFNFNNATVTLGGTVTALVRSIDLTIENNISRQQTDDVTPLDVWEGQRQVSLGFDLMFENLDEYNKFHYGSAAGTDQSDEVYTTSAKFEFTLGDGTSVAFDLPRIAYEEFPVDPNPGGDPIVASVRAVGQRGGTPIITATVINDVATY